MTPFRALQAKLVAAPQNGGATRRPRSRRATGSTALGLVAILLGSACDDNAGVPAEHGELHAACINGFACGPGLSCDQATLTCVLAQVEQSSDGNETTGTQSGTAAEISSEQSTTFDPSDTTSASGETAVDETTTGDDSVDPCGPEHGTLATLGGVDIDVAARRVTFAGAAANVHYRGSRASRTCIQAIEVSLETDGDCKIELRARDVVNNEYSDAPRMQITDLRLTLGQGCDGVEASDYGVFEGHGDTLAKSWIELDDPNLDQPDHSPACIPQYQLKLHVEGQLDAKSTLAHRRRIEVLAGDMELRGPIVAHEALGACPVACTDDSQCAGDRICGLDASCQGCESCGDDQICVGDVCEELVCEADAFRCDERELLSCDEHGTLERKSAVCDEAGQCDAEQGACTYCVPGRERCRGDLIEVCDKQGHGWSAERRCAVGERCDPELAECVALACQPLALFCQDDELRECDSEGIESTLVERCGDGEICQAHLGRCEERHCLPEGYFCFNNERHRCDARGAASTMIEDCFGNSELRQCHMGACVPDRFSEVGGESESITEYAFTFGNLYEASQRTTLYGFDAALDVKIDGQALQWMVYERSNDGDSTYRRVVNLTSSLTRGRGYFRSPPMNVWLDSGHRYFLVVSGAQGIGGNANTYTSRLVAPGDDGGETVKFGQMLSAHAWSQANALGDTAAASRLMDAQVVEVGAQRVYTAQ